MIGLVIGQMELGIGSRMVMPKQLKSAIKRLEELDKTDIRWEDWNSDNNGGWGDWKNHDDWCCDWGDYER